MCKLTDVFDRVVVINMATRPDRRERMQRRIDESGLFDSAKVEWARAVDGQQSPAPAWFVSGNGAWGCLMSHHRILTDAAMDGVESVLIIEDDAVFAPEAAAHFRVLIDHWPKEWGQIYLGGQHLAQMKPAEEGGVWFRGTNVNRTHCHAFHRSVFSQAARHILHAPDYVQARGNWHVDHQLGLAHGRGDWPVYASRWWLAGQEAGASNISSRMLPEMWWQQIPSAMVPPVVVLPAEATPEMVDKSGCFHYGNNAIPGTCQDSGIAAAVGNDKALLAFLRMISGEALLHRRLPAIQHPDATPDRIAEVWPGECYTLAPWEAIGLVRETLQRCYDLTLAAA